MGKFFAIKSTELICSTIRAQIGILTKRLLPNSLIGINAKKSFVWDFTFFGLSTTRQLTHCELPITNYSHFEKWRIVTDVSSARWNRKKIIKNTSFQQFFLGGIVVLREWSNFLSGFSTCFFKDGTWCSNGKYLVANDVGFIFWHAKSSLVWHFTNHNGLI